MNPAMRILPFLAVFLAALSLRAESILPANARVAVIGDSITEQKLYSKYIETYLLACTGRKDIKVFQFGWSGERAGGFATRLENDLAVFNPNVATTCYGMNDGSYKPYAPEIGAEYEKNMRAVIAGLQKVGVKAMAAVLAKLKKKLADEHAKQDANVRKTLQPVTYTIMVQELP